MLKRLAVMMFLLAPALGACETARPFDYDAFDKRPGLFTGEAGEYVVYGQ